MQAKSDADRTEKGHLTALSSYLAHKLHRSSTGRNIFPAASLSIKGAPMIYRTAFRTTYNDLTTNLGLSSYRIAELTNQVASERRINTPSDDPTGAATVLSTRSTLSAIEQYSTNISVSNLWLTDSGTAAQSIKETLDQIYVKAEQGATDTYNAEQRQIIAEEIKVLFDSIVVNGNHSIGDTYIFAGQDVLNQPFSLQVEAQKVKVGCENSDEWTGQVLNYGDPTFNNRPDLPELSQNFLVEVVQPGGVDSRWYTYPPENGLNTAQINGSNGTNDYTLEFEATDKAYNSTSIKFVTGPENLPTLGGIDFTVPAGETDPINIVYGIHTSSASATSAAWDDVSNTLTVYLHSDGDNPPTSQASAQGVIDAVDALGAPFAGTAALADPAAGAAIVGQGQTSFNHSLSYEVNGDQKSGYEVTVYLERAEGEDGAVTTTVNQLEGLFGNGFVLPGAAPGDPPVQIVELTHSGGGLQIVEPTFAETQLSPGDPYTIAHVSADPKGTQNELVWGFQNTQSYTVNGVECPSFVGADGNNFTIEYRVPENKFSNETTVEVEYDDPDHHIVVNLAVSAAVYYEAYSDYYLGLDSGAFQNAELANELALEAAIMTTANDVQALVAQSSAEIHVTDVNGDPQVVPLSEVIDVKHGDGSSGEGKLNRLWETSFDDGYDQPALFRVSQDGGKTWGPPMSFDASEYETGDMFYNEYLGHASLTTNFPGAGNDLIFTAKEMGTWGNSVRVSYEMAETPNTPATVEMGDSPWNICVYLEHDGNGNIKTTANEIKDLVNDHPIANQLVTADLANYHEGGGGVVDFFACSSLTVGEPYEVNGKSVITPLGHATGSVTFPYNAVDSKSPNIDFQALEQGEGGNDIGIRYTTSADPTFYSSATVASDSYQDFTSVRYEYDEETGKEVVVVHLATTVKPACPDDAEHPGLAEEWREAWPLYSCSSANSAMAVTTTAGEVVNAIITKNLENPEDALIWPSLERWTDEGLEAAVVVGPTNGTIWLDGGNETEDASNHGVNLKFLADGSSLQTGDIFEVPVGWYSGDENNIDINAGSDYQTTMNVTGNELLGNTGNDDNILDTLQRLIWALESNDSELVGRELPALQDAITGVVTVETKLGTQQIRNEFVSQTLDMNKYNSEALLSQVEDVDFAALITELKNAQTVYEAILGATGLTNNTSLLNYI